MENGETPAISITPPDAPGFPLTKEFLELAFSKEVENFSTEVGTNPGDNYLSIMHAVDVYFKGESSPKHYLIKCYPNHPGRREFLDEINVFEKELFMYDDFLLQLNKLAVESGAEAEVALSLAPYHGGNVVASNVTTFFKDTPWAKENFIVMTDLRKTNGCRMVDRLRGLDVTHAKAVLKEIAKLHALSWAYKQKHGLRLLTSKYTCFEDHMYDKEEMIAQFKPMMDSMSDSTASVVEEALGVDHPACKNLRAFLATDTIQFMKDCLLVEGIDEEKQEKFLRVKPKDNKDSVKEPWLVAAHGDCWVNNMLFRYDESQASPKEPKEVTLVDFQITREACPTTDLAYFLFSSVRAPLRIKYEEEFLRVYFDAFNSHCQALNVKTLPGFTFENLQRRYTRAKLFGLLLSLPLLTIVLKPKEESIDLDQQEGGNIMELFSTVMEGADKNSLYKAEMTANVKSLYEDGVI